LDTTKMSIDQVVKTVVDKVNLLEENQE